MSPLLSSRGNNAPYRLIIGYLSIFIGLAGVICLLPLLMIAIYPTEWGAYPAFLIPGGAAVIMDRINNVVYSGGNFDSVVTLFILTAAACLLCIVACFMGTERRSA